MVISWFSESSCVGGELALSSVEAPPGPVCSRIEVEHDWQRKRLKVVAMNLCVAVHTLSNTQE